MPVTLSEQLLFTGLGAGAIVGFRGGFLDYGIIGGTIGGLLGLVAGGVVGGLPYFILDYLLRRELREMRGSSTEQLHARLRSRLRADYQLSHYILTELDGRGEPMESLREAIREQLRSPSEEERWFGADNARRWLSDSAELPQSLPEGK